MTLQRTLGQRQVVFRLGVDIVRDLDPRAMCTRNASVSSTTVALSSDVPLVTQTTTPLQTGSVCSRPNPRSRAGPPRPRPASAAFPPAPRFFSALSSISARRRCRTPLPMKLLVRRHRPSAIAPPAHRRRRRRRPAAGACPHPKARRSSSSSSNRSDRSSNSSAAALGQRVSRPAPAGAAAHRSIR